MSIVGFAQQSQENKNTSEKKKLYYRRFSTQMPRALHVSIYIYIYIYNIEREREREREREN